MSRAISSNFRVRDNAPFLIAVLLNEGADEARRLRDAAQRQLSRARLSAARRNDLLQQAALTPICNLTDNDREELRVLVDLWLKSDGLWPKFQAELLRHHLPVVPYTSFRVTRFADGSEAIHSAQGTSEAQGLMLQLIQHPESWRLGGRCITCERYMLRKVHRDMKYCGPKCKGRKLISGQNRENRKRVRERKLIHLRAAAQAWQMSKTAEPCEAFMLREAQKAWDRDMKRAEWRTIAGDAEHSIKRNSLTKWSREGLIQIPIEKDGRA
jgi:hypothetical protein